LTTVEGHIWYYYTTVDWWELLREKQMKLRYLKPRTKIYIGGRWMVRLAALVLISLVVGVVGMVAGLAYIARDLPSPDRVVRREYSQ